MAFRFTIGKKLGAGFGVLLFFIVVVFYTTNNTLNRSIKINDEITDVNKEYLKQKVFKVSLKID